jgi:hypothetical protein
MASKSIMGREAGPQCAPFFLCQPPAAPSAPGSACGTAGGTGGLGQRARPVVVSDQMRSRRSRTTPEASGAATCQWLCSPQHHQATAGLYRHDTTYSAHASTACRLVFSDALGPGCLWRPGLACAASCRAAHSSEFPPGCLSMFLAPVLFLGGTKLWRTYRHGRFCIIGITVGWRLLRAQYFDGARQGEESEKRGETQ